MDQNNNLVPLNDKITDDCIPASLIFQVEAAYCLQDTLRLTKAILKCQLDIFEQIGLILAELAQQSQALQRLIVEMKNG